MILRKGLLIGLLVISLGLTACSNKKNNNDISNVTESDEQIDIANQDAGDGSKDVDVSGTSEDESANETDSVVQSGPYGSLSIKIPDSWEYEQCEVGYDEFNCNAYGIRFKPEGANGGYVSVLYNSNFGVCGTGLKSEDVTIAGVQASMGYMDGAQIWDFVYFTDSMQGVIAQTDKVDSWWDDYSDEVLSILDTIKYNPNDTSGGVGIYSEESEINEIHMMLTAVKVSNTGATIRFNQYDDNTEGELLTGEHFMLEQSVDGNWVACPTVIEDYGFNDIGLILNKNGYVDHEYKWEWLYGVLKPGDYRMALCVLCDQKEYNAYVHFILR